MLKIYPLVFSCLVISSSSSPLLGADWLRYHNQLYGIEFAYPPDAKISRHSEVNGLVMTVNSLHSKDLMNSALSKGEFTVQVFITPKNNMDHKHWDDACLKSTTTFIIGKYSGSITEWDENKGEGHGQSLCVKANNYLYRFDTTGSYGDVSETDRLLNSIKLSKPIDANNDTPILIGANVTTPQSLSLPVIIPFSSNRSNAVYDCITVEPGLYGQKFHLMHLMTAGGAGPAAWSYNISTLYMTKRSFGLRKNQVYIGGEIGGMVLNATTSIGLYGNISSNKKGPRLFVSVSVGVMNLYDFVKFLSKVPS